MNNDQYEKMLKTIDEMSATIKEMQTQIDALSEPNKAIAQKMKSTKRNNQRYPIEEIKTLKTFIFKGIVEGKTIRKIFDEVDAEWPGKFSRQYMSQVRLGSIWKDL